MIRHPCCLVGLLQFVLYIARDGIAQRHGRCNDLVGLGEYYTNKNDNRWNDNSNNSAVFEDNSQNEESCGNYNFGLIANRNTEVMEKI